MFHSIDQTCIRSIGVQQYQLDLCQYQIGACQYLVVEFISNCQELEVPRCSAIGRDTAVYGTQALKAAIKAVGATALAPVTLAFGAARGAATGVLAGAAGGTAAGAAFGGIGGAAVGLPVGAALGGVYGSLGGAVGGANGAFQWILGDEYLNSSNKALFTPQTRAHSPRNKRVAKRRVMEIAEVDVPFQIVIADLFFEGMWADTRLLVI
jgi:hypothetical protein